MLYSFGTFFLAEWTRHPWALSLCLCCLITSPDIQISFMSNEHVAEVKYLICLRCRFIYTHLFHCMIKTPKSKLPVQNLGSLTYGSIFKIAIFGHEIWPFSKSCTYTLFLFHVVQIKLNFRSTGSSFRATGPFTKLPYLGIKLATGKSSRSCTYTLSTPDKLILFSLHPSEVSEIRTDFQNCHIWHET